MLNRTKTLKLAIVTLFVLSLAATDLEGKDNSLESGVRARGQIVRGGLGKGRRVGRVTLPTPPYNPDAGILSEPKGRSRNSPKAAPRRSAKRHIKINNRNPNPRKPRKRRVRLLH